MSDPKLDPAVEIEPVIEPDPKPIDDPKPQPEPKPAYVKADGEYVFTLQDSEGREIMARAAILDPTNPGGASAATVGNDTLALFPDRSSNHRRIAAFLEALHKEEATHGTGPVGD